VDGKKHTSVKSKLAGELVEKITTELPQHVDTYIIDDMYMIRSLDLKNLPATLWRYSYFFKHILNKICFAPVVHFVVCDTYTSRSMKSE
jgi:hypothetical protein